MKRSLFATVLVGVSILLLSACMALPIGLLIPSAGTPESAPADAAATVRIGWPGGPDTLHPGMTTFLDAFTIFDLVYDSLYRLQPDGSITPELVTDVGVSDDGREWTFTIQDGVTWQDGEPLTAGDVAYSLNLYMATEAYANLHPYTAFFASVEATDEFTVVLTLTEAIPNLESQLLYLYVLPEHIWREVQGEDLLAFENREMIGSGPFQLIDYVQDEFVHLAANPAYAGPAPVVDEVIFQTFDDHDAMVQALRNDDLDMITVVPTTAVAELQQVENIAVVMGPPALPVVDTIFFNQMTPESCPPDDGLCTGHPALRDRTLRLALAHATDKQQLIDVVLLGFGSPGLTLIPDSLGVWFNASLTEHGYDSALANRILDEAGYLDTDGDGVRELPGGGEPLVLRINWPSDITWAPQTADLLSQMWEVVGVAVEPQAMDPDALLAICCPTFDYDVILWGWGSEPDPQFLLSLMTTDQIATGMNETGYTNPAYDALFAQQAVTLDPETRREIVWEMQHIVHDDVVYIIPFYSQAVQAYRTDRFMGWITDAPSLKLSDISSLLVVEPVE